MVSVIRSLIAPPDIINLVTFDYGIKNSSVLLLSPGLNDTYLIRSSSQRWILRIYRADWRTLSEISSEVQLLLHLMQSNVKVSYPVASLNGEYIKSVNAPEGVRYFVLFTYINGEQPDLTDVAVCRQYGSAAARFHAMADGFQDKTDRFSLDLEYLVNRSLSAISSLLDENDHQLGYLIGLGQRLSANISNFDQSGLDQGWCHGDFHPENARYHQSTITLFDFDFCGSGWRSYDLATVLWSLNSYGRQVKSASDIDVYWQALLEGYFKFRQLSQNDIDVLPSFVAARHFWMMGLHASTAPIFGYERFSTRYFDNTIGFLKTWEQTHL